MRALLAGTAVLLPGTPMLLGQSAGTQPRLVLQALDTNHDGQLSPAERAAAATSLLTLDRNGDGTLTVDELQPRPGNAGATADELTRQLMQFDKNSDGVLTADELPARLQGLLQRGDTNHDGRLTSDELRGLAAHQGMPAGADTHRGMGVMRMDPLLFALDTDHDGVLSAAEIAAAPAALLVLDTNHDSMIEAEEMRPRQASPEERVNHLFAEWDTNQDGRISKAESPDRLQQQFESIDTNADGFLDREELLQYFRATSNGPAQAPSSPSSQSPKEPHQ